jgi:hypothetical protein
LTFGFEPRVHLQDPGFHVVDDRIMLLRPPRKSGQLKAVGDIAVCSKQPAMSDQDADLVAISIDKRLTFAGTLTLLEPRPKGSFANLRGGFYIGKRETLLVARAVFVVTLDLPRNRLLLTDFDQIRVL